MQPEQHEATGRLDGYGAHICRGNQRLLGPAGDAFAAEPQPVISSSSDRQTGSATLAATADHSAASVGAHPHPETGDALAFAAGSFKGALTH